MGKKVNKTGLVYKRCFVWQLLVIISNYLQRQKKNTGLICCHSLWDVYNKIPSCLESVALSLLYALTHPRDKLTRQRNIRNMKLTFLLPAFETVSCNPRVSFVIFYYYHFLILETEFLPMKEKMYPNSC